MPIIDYIPESYKDGFGFISSFSEADFSAIINSLSEIGYVATFKGLCDGIVKINSSLDKSNVEDILLSAGSLIPLIEDENKIGELISDIDLLCLNEEIISKKDSGKFKRRLLKLLQNKQVYYTAKARELISETENLFISCRIVSDIRPIFDYDLSKQPSASLIIHNLHIHYQADIAAPHEDIFLSLDLNDIKKLKDVLVRAEKKEETLKILLSKKEINKLK